MSQGRLVILSGPSGVGKDTVINAWQARNPDVARVVAYTTRQPRDGEIDGFDYNFISAEIFNAKADDGDFLEYKAVHGNWYATPKTDMEELLSEGKIAILKIDVQGALTVMGLRPGATTVFLMPPDENELHARIRGRGTESAEAVEKRMKAAKEEMELSRHYQFKVTNVDVEDTVDELERILQ
jgi:guanylate kinase